MEVYDREGKNCVIKKRIKTSKPVQKETGQEMFVCITDSLKEARH